MPGRGQNLADDRLQACFTSFYTAMAVASWKHRVRFSIIATSFAISTMNQEPLFWATTTDSSSTGMNLGEKRMPSGEKYDGLWVSHGKYLAMNENLKNRLEWPFLAG